MSQGHHSDWMNIWQKLALSHICLAHLVFNLKEAVPQALGPGALGRPRGIGWRGRWEGRSGWGIHVYPWLIHVSVWQKPLKKYIYIYKIKMKRKKIKIKEAVLGASSLYVQLALLSSSQGWSLSAGYGYVGYAHMLHFHFIWMPLSFPVNDTLFCVFRFKVGFTHSLNRPATCASHCFPGSGH